MRATTMSCALAFALSIAGFRSPVLAQGPDGERAHVENWAEALNGELPHHSVSTPLPKPLKVITLTPETVDQLRETLRDAQPGTNEQEATERTKKQQPVRST